MRWWGSITFGVSVWRFVWWGVLDCSPTHLTTGTAVQHTSPHGLQSNIPHHRDCSPTYLTARTAVQHTSPHGLQSNIPHRTDCSPTHLTTRNVTHLHQTLCCPITTFNRWQLNFKFSDFNKEPTNFLMMIWMMIETCWSVFKCFNINILD